MQHNRKSAMTLWAILWVIWLALIILPESRGIFRLGFILLTAFQLTSSLILFWQHQRIRYINFTIIILILLPFILPGRPPEPQALRQHYIQSLTRYEGTPYSWGGENQLGIDCSGLVRKGFITANFTQGLQTLNGNQIRHAASLWWHDASAKAMRDQYRDTTTLLLKADAINTLDHSPLQPGDFAITANGVHALVYTGDNTWMQACPDHGIAQYETLPVQDSTWFTQPVHIMRWKMLEQ